MIKHHLNASQRLYLVNRTPRLTILEIMGWPVAYIAIYAWSRTIHHKIVAAFIVGYYLFGVYVALRTVYRELIVRQFEPYKKLYMGTKWEYLDAFMRAYK